jgi:hypothetical protein
MTVVSSSSMKMEKTPTMATMYSIRPCPACQPEPASRTSFTSAPGVSWCHLWQGSEKGVAARAQPDGSATLAMDSHALRTLEFEIWSGWPRHAAFSAEAGWPDALDEPETWCGNSAGRRGAPPAAAEAAPAGGTRRAPLAAKASRGVLARRVAGHRPDQVRARPEVCDRGWRGLPLLAAAADLIEP